MFFLSRPSEARIQAVRESQKAAGFSFAEVGATRGEQFPRGFNIDRNAVRLGEGEAVFLAARTALRQWRMMELGWVRAFPAVPEVAIVVRHFGFWSVNVNRIIYTVDTPDCFGLAYGTLAEHAESGEERFTVTRRSDGSVWYEIAAFSRPRHLLAKLGYPLTRALQKRFARDSLRKMAALSCGS